MQGCFAGNGYGNLTQTAGTRIQFLIPPYVPGVTRVTRAVYTAGGTAHTLTFLRPIGNTTVVGAAASGQAVVNIAADPGGTTRALQANDYVAIREKDGVTRAYKVSSISTLAVTLTTNLTAGCLGGEKFWDFGITTTADPVTGLAHPNYAGTAATAVTYQDSDSGVVAGLRLDDPILFDSNNATAAGTLNQLNWTFTKS